MFSYRDETLHCENIPLTALAEQYGTPLYVYSTQAVIRNCRAIEAALHGTRHSTSYAAKANSNRHLLRLICDQGLGVDVNSRGEMYLALAAGFVPDRITFSGVGKTTEELDYGLAHDIHAFNVESKEEIEILNSLAVKQNRRARILVRVNLDIDAGGHAYVSTSLKVSKFGMSLRAAAETIAWAHALAGIKVRGIHSHIGSQILKPETFKAAAKALVSFVRETKARGVPVEDLDFGGGYGVQYKGVLTHPHLPNEVPEAVNLSPSSFIKGVLPDLQETGCRISIQPGRSIVADAGILITKVLYRKEMEAKTFVIVDSGMNDLLRPSLYNAYHQIVPVRVTNAQHENVDVVGPLCESGDFFARDRTLQKCTPDDILAVMCTGAYGFVLSSNYNARPRPAEVLVDGGESKVIRERETIEHL